MLNFSERLKEERKRLGHNQASFGDAAGVSKTTQFNYEKGDRQPDAAYFSAVAEIGVDIQYLITGKRSGLSVSEARANYVLQEKASPISQMVLTDSPDVAVLRQVIERVERILMDEQISLSPEQKARVIVACVHASLKEGGDAGSHISTAIRAVI